MRQSRQTPDRHPTRRTPCPPCTRLQGLRRAVPAAAPARPRRRRRDGRLRLRLDQRPLPALAPHRRPRAQRARLAGRRHAGHDARDPGHERPHAVVPLQPGGRRAGVRDPGLPGARPRDPGRGHGRVHERGPGRGRLARAERAVRAPAGVRAAHPGAVGAGRGVRRLRGPVLPHPRGDDLRQAGPARADLHRGLGAGRRPSRRAARRRLHLHQRQGRGAVHRDAPAGAGRGGGEGRPRRRPRWTG